MADEVVVNVETPEGESDAVKIAEIQAESLESRITALAEATAALHIMASEFAALRAAFEEHVRSNETDFAALSERVAVLERGMAVMQEALEEEAEVVEDLIREEIREEIAAEVAEEIEEEIAEETGEAIASGEVPASVEAAQGSEPAPQEVIEDRKERRRHFVSLHGKLG